MATTTLGEKKCIRAIYGSIQSSRRPQISLCGLLHVFLLDATALLEKCAGTDFTFCCLMCSLRLDQYAKAEDKASTHKPWTEQEVLLLLEVCAAARIACPSLTDGGRVCVAVVFGLCVIFGGCL